MALVREESKVFLSRILVVLTCSGYFSQEAPSKYGSNVSQQVQAKAPEKRDVTNLKKPHSHPFSTKLKPVTQFSSFPLLRTHHVTKDVLL